MNIFKKVSTPLYNHIRYNHSLLLKDLKPKRLVSESVEMTFKGPK